MKTGYYYSKSTGFYVSRRPLLIDSRVKNAGEQLGLKLDWTDTGWINYIDFDDAKKLLTRLNSIMLSPVDYWLVLRDAVEECDADMVIELTSPDYCEWLDRVYLRDGYYIDHPQISGKYNYSGRKHKTNCPLGRPGWFTPENNINYESGEPINVSLSRKKLSESWKYWSPDHAVTKLDALAPIRGYVTSVGKPSFDTGIPVDSKQPVQVIRECKLNPVELSVPAEVQAQAEALLEPYLDVVANLQDTVLLRKHMENGLNLESFVKKYGHYYFKSKELQAYKTREKLFDSMGLYSAQIQKNGVTIKFNDFKEFLVTSEIRLENALKTNKDIVFVMGHKNPDTDAIVSSIVEAYRNHLLDGDLITYIPIIQYYEIPDEVQELIGNEVSDKLVLSENLLYQKAKESGLVRWISVDQNFEPEVQKYFISIVDHHVISESAKKIDLPKTLEMVGSSTSLVTQKLLGMGYKPDKKLATMLYGASLMDTENRVAHKMTVKDVVIMDYLKSLAQVTDDNKLYANLMSYLLNSVDTEILFKRDYKQDWGFGFAVAKVKNNISGLARLLELTKNNTVEKNLPLTILRVTEYAEDNITVNKETIYCSFNNESTQKFKEVIWDLLENIILFEFPETNIKRTSESIEFWGTGLQLSRKKTAPMVEVVVKAFSEYFYSKSIKKWVKRTFLTDTNITKTAAKLLNIPLSTDAVQRVNYVTYLEAKALVTKINFDMLSLPELWLVIDDANEKNDLQMLESLQGSNFVEFTDTVLTKVGDKRYQYNHPTVVDGIVQGIHEEIELPLGNPGLIRPKDIDRCSGLPTKVLPPNEYGQAGLWRYWQPDADVVTVARSYIFLLQQPCWDGKFHLEDSLPNLGVRPCCNKLPEPDVSINRSDSVLTITVKKDGDTLIYKCKKGYVGLV